MSIETLNLRVSTRCILRGAHGPSIENRINLGFSHNSSEAIKEAKKSYSDVDGCFYCCPESHRR